MKYRYAYIFFQLCNNDIYILDNDLNDLLPSR